MVVAISDFRVNSMVRSILCRHWIDLRALRFGSFRGTVRLVGELHLCESRDPNAFTSSTLDVLETEIRRLPGVSRVYFDFKNWRRSPSGDWQSTSKARSQTPVEDARTRTFTLGFKDQEPKTDD